MHGTIHHRQRYAEFDHHVQELGHYYRESGSRIVKVKRGTGLYKDFFHSSPDQMQWEMVAVSASSADKKQQLCHQCLSEKFRIFQLEALEAVTQKKTQIKA